MLLMSGLQLAFPKLYTEIDRARNHLGRASIGLERIKIWTADDPYPHGQVHVLIHSGQVEVFTNHVRS